MDRVELEFIDRRAESERRVTEHYTRLQRSHVESLRVAEQEATNQRLTFNLALQAAQQRARATRKRVDIPPSQAFIEYRQVVEQKSAYASVAERTLRSAETAVEAKQRVLSDVQHQARVHESRLEALETRRHVGIRQNEVRLEATHGEELCAMVAGQQKRELVRGAAQKHADALSESSQQSVMVHHSAAIFGVGGQRTTGVYSASTHRDDSSCAQDGASGSTQGEGAASCEGTTAGTPLTLTADAISLAVTTVGEGMARREQTNQGMGRGSSLGSEGNQKENPRSSPRSPPATGTEMSRTDVTNLCSHADMRTEPLVQFGYRLEGGQIVRVELKKTEQGTIEVQLAPELFADRHLLARSLREVRNSMRQHGFKVRI